MQSIIEDNEVTWNDVIPKLSESADKDIYQWKNELKKTFKEVLGLNSIEKNSCPLNFCIENEEDKGSYRRIRFTFESEIGARVPCYLCVPNTGKEKYPVVITLQGHTSGFHNSVGIVKYYGDEEYQKRGDFALQAVKNGFIGLAIEQRGFGERRPTKRERQTDWTCRYNATIAASLGRTIIGERVWDVHKAIDALSNFSKCDMDKIIITGNSGGGTASFFATCFDERIKLGVPSCSFCPYVESIFEHTHCICNYIPNAYQYFDMPDLAGLIAPRNLIIIAGKEDKIFPIEGVRRGYEKVKRIFARFGKEGNCRLVETPKGHWWCQDLAWTAIKEECEKLGWK